LAQNSDFFWNVCFNDEATATFGERAISAIALFYPCFMSNKR